MEMSFFWKNVILLRSPSFSKLTLITSVPDKVEVIWKIECATQKRN